jgi:hypothetical protein
MKFFFNPKEDTFIKISSLLPLPTFAKTVLLFAMTPLIHLLGPDHSESSLIVKKNAQPLPVNRTINVNLYGSASYSNAAWNNWNVNSSLVSPLLKYSDGALSSITSVLSAQSSYADNGSSYPVTMCPQIVGEDVSYATSARNDTLKGLDNTKLYDIQLYSSRANPGQTTRFTINGLNVDVATNNNFTNIAAFNNIAPVSGRIIITLTSLASYNYLNGFTLTEKSNTGNQSPVANAGTDQAIVLPTTSLTLFGAGSDPDGTVNSYAWTQIGGIAANILNPASATTGISGLSTSGQRIFRLTVTDNLGDFSFDDVIVSVNAAPGTEINVNLYGSNTYNSSAWNNWNSASSLVSPVLKYNNGANSTITSVLSAQTNIGDNGAGYSVIMCPAQVGRDASFATAKRYDTLKGLDNTKTYDLQLYATRGNPGQTTRFTINTTNIDIATDNNFTNIATFANITPVSEKIIIAMTSLNTYNYLNGFTLTERTTANPLPAANAGKNQSITLPQNQVTLTGSGSPGSGHAIQSYSWTKISGGNATIVSPSSPATNVIDLLEGNYIFRFTVTNDSSASASSDVQVTVNPVTIAPPVANAGTDQTIQLPKDSTILNGSSSSGAITSYLWSKVSGPAAGIIASPSASATNISGLTAGTYVFSLSLNNGASKDSVIIIVRSANQPPTANAGNNQTITLPVSSTTLSGSGTDVDGTIASYAWSQVSGPSASQIVSPLQASTSVNNLIQGSYVFRLMVTDNQSATGSSNVTVTVNNNTTMPSVTSSADQTISGTSTIVSSTSSSPYPITKTTWTKFSVPGQSLKRITVVGSSTSSAYGLPSVDSGYAWRLQKYYKQQNIIDTIFNLAISGQAVDQVDITTALNKGAPILFVNYPSNGYDTYTVPYVISWYQRIKDSCDKRGVEFYTTGTQPRDEYTAAVRAKLIVINDSLRLRFGARFLDFLTPMMNPADNSIKTEYGQGDLIHINSTGHEKFFQIVRAANIFQNLISSPSIITNSSLANTSITGMQPGDNRFQVSVFDSRGFAASSVSKITVNPFNQPPVARAGADKTITLPLNSVSLNGSSSSDDHNIVAFHWTKFSGTAGTIDFPDSSATTFSGLTAGVYNIELLVTDDSSAIGRDTVQVRVFAANQPPVANAGLDQTVTLPSSSALLSGSGTDVDGTIASYAWTQTGGTAATIVNPGAASTNITGLNTTGARTFRLTVTDNSGTSATDDIVITVNPAPPTQNKLINVNLYGSASYSNAAWNNWNISNLASAAFKYSDGTQSTISSVLSAQSSYADNGSSYPVTMCPQLVGEDASYHTAIRYDTLKGLDNTKLYDLQLYASRANPGQTTRFAVNGANVDIATYNNYTSIATFSNISPAAGKIIVTMTPLSTYTYLNGFTLTEKTITTGRMMTSTDLENNSSASTQNNNAIDGKSEETFAGSIGIYPNPVKDKFTMVLQNSYTGMLNIDILSQNGMVVKSLRFEKYKGPIAKEISSAGLPQGIFFVRVYGQNFASSIKIIKL